MAETNPHRTVRTVARGRGIALPIVKKRSAVALALCACIVAAGIALAVYRTSSIRLKVAGVPGREGTRSIPFKVRDASLWWTEQFGYLWIEGIESRWALPWTPGRSSMGAVVRVRGSRVIGEHVGHENLDGVVVLFTETGSETWRVVAGRIEVSNFLEGVDAILRLQLSRVDPETRAVPTSDTGDDSIALTLRGARSDLGTPLHCFNPRYIKAGRELRYWLAEDPGLVTLLPQQTLSWGLDRSTDQ